MQVFFALWFNISFLYPVVTASDRFSVRIGKSFHGFPGLLSYVNLSFNAT